MNIITLVIILLVLLFQLYYLYYNVLHNYCRNKDNTITYDYLIQLIQVVSKNNYFMNYGLWNETTTSLRKANKNLCQLIHDKGLLNSTDQLKILDVGCGYGAQDIKWASKLSPDSSIIAVDISEKQIEYADKKRIKKQIPSNRLKYVVGDAHKLTKQFGKKEFNRIVSLESAFHYKNRPLFFRNVSKLLSNDGIFVICDIVLNDTNKGFFKQSFINVASDFLYIPPQNLIGIHKWKKQLTSSGLEIIKIEDLTNKTFVPYYRHFFKTYVSQKGLPDIIGDWLFCVFTNAQPFSYVLAVCRREV